jgi:hypothetical protein
VSGFVVVVHCFGGWVFGLVFWGVWVLFVNSIVCLFVFLCLFFVFECFWLGLLAGLVFVWLVFLGFNVFVFVRRV